METGGGIMRGLGRSTASMLTSLFCSVLVQILWIIFIFPINPTLSMLYISFPIAWTLTSITHYTLSAITIHREIKKLNRQVSVTKS